MIAFNVTPAYYQTYWFSLSCVAISIALLWALYRWRIHRLKSQEKRLRDAVETIQAMTFTTLFDGSNTFANDGQGATFHFTLPIGMTETSSQVSLVTLE